jgi:hypothetical protein
MATPPSDDSKAMFRILSNRPDEWWPYEELRDAVATTIPPGRAIRKYQERLNSSRRTHSTAKPAPELSEDEQIFFGARACAQIAISSWVGRGIMRRQDSDGKKWVRIKPGFKTYGITVNMSEETEASQDPKGPENAEGYTDLPPGDSGPSEGQPRPAEAAAEPTVEPGQTAYTDPERSHKFLREGERDGWMPEEWKEPVISPVLEGPLAELASEEAAFVPDEQSTPERPPVTVSDLRECPECGLQVVNQVRHDAWHEAQKQPFEQKEMALFDEVTMRTLLSDVMGQSLDRFQLGMEQYLSGRFAEVEEMIQALRRPVWQGTRWTDGVVRKRAE